MCLVEFGILGDELTVPGNSVLTIVLAITSNTGNAMGRRFEKIIGNKVIYRQIQMFKQQGITIAPATINDWFAQVAGLMRPAGYRLKELVLACDYIQSDETTIPIIHNEKHQTVKGYLWTVRAVMKNLVFFHYAHGSRAQKVALGLFIDYQGVIQTDGYSVYDMYEHKKGVLPIGCWAHARPKFDEA